MLVYFTHCKRLPTFMIRAMPFAENLRQSTILVTAATAALLFALPVRVSAQTDYYNTDGGRPLQVEDAYATERYSFELHLAPLRLERTQGAVYNWAAEPKIEFGILPRTQIELGLPVAYVDQPRLGRHVAGAAGLELSVLHNLNTETETLPAFAVVGDVLAPAGGLGPDRAYPSVKGIATRTYSWLRFHVNGQYTFSDRSRDSASTATSASAGIVELSRWWAGVAVDKTFPLRSMLIGAETYARQPIVPGEPVQWNAGVGIRYQLAPQFALDGGVGARLSGDNRSWYFTVGTAYAFGLRSLVSVPRAR